MPKVTITLTEVDDEIQNNFFRELVGRGADVDLENNLAVVNVADVDECQSLGAALFPLMPQHGDRFRFTAEGAGSYSRLYVFAVPEREAAILGGYIATAAGLQ